MYLKQTFSSQISRQSGFLIPVAAILVVGIGVLAIAISRLASQSSQASFVEAVSAQAFYAAESGAQAGMSRLLFNVTDRGDSDTNCGTIDGDSIAFTTVVGLRGCSADLTCSVSSAAGSIYSYYTIRSVGMCGGGDISAERIVEVSSFF